MMLEIHLYGKLRSLISEAKPNEDTVLNYEFIENETFAQLVQRLGLKPSDLGDCFLNGTLVKPGDRVSDGDRLGMFPFNMVFMRRSAPKGPRLHTQGCRCRLLLGVGHEGLCKTIRNSPQIRSLR
jgi:hypothetical protein